MITKMVYANFDTVITCNYDNEWPGVEYNMN